MAITPAIGKVVDLRSGRRRHTDYATLACGRFAALCQTSGLSREELAERLSAVIGTRVTAGTVAAWETRVAPPSSVMLAMEDLARAAGGDLPAGDQGLLLDPVPHSFPADVLAGPWVTTYQFLHHGETPRCHVDIAHVTVTGERGIRAVNHPPEPRSEGRANPFRNEIEAQLVGRHLVGTWKNTSDTRYFGAVQLAVLPGEAAMEGFFSGVGSDVHVSTGYWKWVRLAAAPDQGLAEVALRDPTVLHELVMNRSQYDAPLAVDDIREDA